MTGTGDRSRDLSYSSTPLYQAASPNRRDKTRIRFIQLKNYICFFKNIYLVVKGLLWILRSCGGFLTSLNPISILSTLYINSFIYNHIICIVYIIWGGYRLVSTAMERSIFFLETCQSLTLYSIVVK